jgi:hypothetical protein
MPPRRFTDSQELDIVNMYLSGLGTGDLAKIFMCHRATTLDVLKRHSIVRRTNSQAQRKYTLDEDVFDVIDSEQKAYWLGFLFADGSTSNSRNSVSLGLAIKDIEHLEKFRNFVGSNLPIKIVDSKLNDKIYQSCYFSFRGYHIHNRLQELGISPNRPNPLITFQNIPEYLKHHWIRGWFDGDGSVVIYKNRYIRYDFLGHNETIMQISEYLDYRSMFSFPYKRSEKLWGFSINNRNTCRKLMDFMYRDATLYLDRKYIKAKTYFEMINETSQK